MKHLSLYLIVIMTYLGCTNMPSCQYSENKLVVSDYIVISDKVVNCKCCNVRVLLCEFNEKPGKEFFDSIQFLCKNGHVESLCTEEDRKYNFTSGIASGWIHSDNNNTFQYVEKNKDDVQINEYTFWRDRNVFLVTMHSCCASDQIEEYVDCKESIVENKKVLIYTPFYSSIHLYCGQDITNGDYKNQIFLAAAAFTGKGYEQVFSHNMIAGDHVSEGVRYKGYRCIWNTGAFVYYNGTYQFHYKDYSLEMDVAARNKGMAFAQEMIIHHNNLVPTNRDENSITNYRALCERQNQLQIIETIEPVSYKEFKRMLLYLEVKEALYLDMGNWSYSWYRNIKGELCGCHRDKNRAILTNAIVFEGAN